MQTSSPVRRKARHPPQAIHAVSGKRGHVQVLPVRQWGELRDARGAECPLGRCMRRNDARLRRLR